MGGVEFAQLRLGIGLVRDIDQLKEQLLIPLALRSSIKPHLNAPSFWRNRPPKVRSYSLFFYHLLKVTDLTLKHLKS